MSKLCLKPTVSCVLIEVNVFISGIRLSSASSAIVLVSVALKRTAVVNDDCPSRNCLMQSQVGGVSHCLWISLVRLTMVLLVLKNFSISIWSDFVIFIPSILSLLFVELFSNCSLTSLLFFFVFFFPFCCFQF